MKRQLFLFLALLIFTNSALNAQTNTVGTQVLPANYSDSALARYKRAIIAYDSQYSCALGTDAYGTWKKPNVAGVRAFDTLFKPILSNVFVGSNDLVQDGPASSFSQDPDKGTLSINYSMFPDPHRWSFLNLGVFSKATDGVFGIYSTGSWSSEIGFNLGYSKVNTKGRYFQEDRCDSLSQSGARQRHYLKTLSRLSSLTNERVKILARHRAVKDSMNFYWLDAGMGISDSAKHYSRLSAEFEVLDSLKKQIELSTPNATQFLVDSFYRAVIDSAIAEFEIQNDIFDGYYLRWWTIRGSIANNAISLNTDSLQSAAKSAYKAKNLLKLNIGWNMSWISNGTKLLQFYRAGVDFGLHNYADHPSVKKPGIRYDSVKAEYVVYNQNAVYHADYADLRSNIVTIEPAFYCTWFPQCFGKMFGWDLRVDSKVPIYKPDEIGKELYPATYSVSTGPVFRLKKGDDVSKGTIGVEIGVIDGPVNDNAWDFFAAKLRVGVPFSALIK